MRTLETIGLLVLLCLYAVALVLAIPFILVYVWEQGRAAKSA